MNKRVQLYALLALFLGPLLVAWIWFFHFEDVRPGTVNEGDLVEPVIPIGDLALHPRDDGGESVRPFSDDWSIVLLAPRTCDATCRNALHMTRQVWIRLNKDAHRVQRVLLAGEDVQYPVGEHPDLHVYAADANALARFENGHAAVQGAQRIYLVDPRGNLMMSYPLDFTPDMLHDDLKRLLRYSDAG